MTAPLRDRLAGVLIYDGYDISDAYDAADAALALLPEEKDTCPATAADPRTAAGAVRCELHEGHDGDHRSWPFRWTR